MSAQIRSTKITGLPSDRRSLVLNGLLSYRRICNIPPGFPSHWIFAFPRVRGRAAILKCPLIFGIDVVRCCMLAYWHFVFLVCWHVLGSCKLISNDYADYGLADYGLRQNRNVAGPIRGQKRRAVPRTPQTEHSRPHSWPKTDPARKTPPDASQNASNGAFPAPFVAEKRIQHRSMPLACLPADYGLPCGLRIACGLADADGLQDYGLFEEVPEFGSAQDLGREGSV